MSVINILSPHVADLIAAGEVVERPASVIKELLENSFDAGAHSVTVEIRNGGTTYIRVTDDGCGMSEDDAGIAFFRHATSKLAKETDLECISTMGFRGEALAAISSVSHMEITTRLRGAESGVRVLLDAGDLTDMLPCGCPEGTTVICRDLFFNTPARLKFLKSDRSESSACIATALRCALGRPDVSVRFIRDGEEEFFSSGDGSAESCIYSLLGREVAGTLLPCRSGSEQLSVSGFVSSPAEGRGNRSNQFFYVNGRYIKSPTIQSALEQAYKNTLLTGRYPACVLYLEIPFGSVDVNVHPAKTEVRFGSEKTVFDFIYHSVRMALENENRSGILPEAETPAPKKPVSNYGTGFSASEPSVFSSCAQIYGEQMRMSGVESSPAAVSPLVTPGPDIYNPQPAVEHVPAHSPEPTSSISAKSAESVDFPPSVNKNVENPVQNVENKPVPDHKISGELFRTYIAVEVNDEIILIDKHAAHERLIFDRLKSEERDIPSQLLFEPVPLHLSPEDCEILEKNGELFGDFGFEIEPYGRNEYIIRALPADMFPSDAIAALEEICSRIKAGESPDPAAARDSILHTVACKAAIKAGWDSSPAELERLAAAVLTGQIKYCPHGRPLSVTVTKYELEKMFKRAT